MGRACLFVDYVLLVRTNNVIYATLVVHPHRVDVDLLTNILSPLLKRNIVQVACVLYIADYL